MWSRTKTTIGYINRSDRATSFHIRRTMSSDTTVSFAAPSALVINQNETFSLQTMLLTKLTDGLSSRNHLPPHDWDQYRLSPFWSSLLPFPQLTLPSLHCVRINANWAFENGCWSAPVVLNSSRTAIGSVCVATTVSGSSRSFFKRSFEISTFRGSSCSLSAGPRPMAWKSDSVVTLGRNALRLLIVKACAPHRRGTAAASFYYGRWW